MKTAIYPGSFDPITLGHLDIIRRSAPCFDRLFVCVMVNCDKKPMFSPEQRLELIRRSVADLPNVEAELYSGLLADYARQKGAGILVKGVRNTTDFDWSINRRPSTGASVRSWRRCCCRPVRPISTSAALWCGR